MAKVGIGKSTLSLSITGREVLRASDGRAGAAGEPVHVGGGPRRVAHHRAPPGLEGGRGRAGHDAGQVGLPSAAHALPGDTPQAPHHLAPVLRRVSGTQRG